MPATYETVRRLALALPGVEEGMSYGTPSLHVRGKLMARLKEDGETVVLKVNPPDRARLFGEEPDTFYTTDHYTARDYPVMLVNLLSVQEAALPTLVEGAWRQVAGKRQVAAWDASSPPGR